MQRKGYFRKISKNNKDKKKKELKYYYYCTFKIY